MLDTTNFIRSRNNNVKTEDCENRNEGKKYDEGKARFDLVLPEFEKDIANVLAYGASKYADNTWQDVPDAKNRYYAALRRHINAYRSGEKIDEESGYTHLAHAACNIMFLTYFEGEK